MNGNQLLTQDEIEVGRALSASIQALQQNVMALLVTEKLYIDKLRSQRGLSEQWVLIDWERGFENGQQNN